MSIETWGLMPKSQIDNETIEEAIERLIAVHEHSPDSHMGENEAIEAHRKSEVIDHLAGSVLADKYDMNTYDFNITFQSITGFNTTGSPSVSALRLILYVESPSINTCRAYMIPFQETQFSPTSYSMLLQFIAWFSNGTVSTAIAEFHRVGFEIEHGRIRGYYWTDGFASQEYTPWYAIDTNNLHSYRAQYFKNEGIARFYIDSDIIGELEFPFTPADEDVIIDFKHTRNTETDASFFISSLKLSLFEK